MCIRVPVCVRAMARKIYRKYECENLDEELLGKGSFGTTFVLKYQFLQNHVKDIKS